MTIPSVREDPTRWNTCVLGGYRFPGYVVIDGGAGVDLDVKKTKGKDGSTIGDNGSENAKLKLVWRYLDRDWPEVQRIVDALNPRKPGARRAPLELQHAPTDLFGINLVYIENISLPKVDKEIHTINVDLIEWTPQPKPTKATAKVPKAEIQRTLEGPGTFVQLLNDPTSHDNAVYHTGPNGSMTEADEDFLNFMQNAL